IIGNTAIGTVLDDGDSNYINASKTTIGGTSLTIASMSVYVGPVGNAPNNQYQVAVYTDIGGAPGALAARSATGTLIANAWNTLPIVAALQPNTTYWLAYNTNGLNGSVNNMRYNVGAAGQGAYTTGLVSFGSWPSNFGAATLTAANYSIYATGITSGDTIAP